MNLTLIKTKFKRWDQINPEVTVIKYLHWFFKPTRTCCHLPRWGLSLYCGEAGCSGQDSCLQAILGVGIRVGARTNPGETTRRDKAARLSRKQRDGLAPQPAGGTEGETQAQLEAALRLRGHHWRQEERLLQPLRLQLPGPERPGEYCTTQEWPSGWPFGLSAPSRKRGPEEAARDERAEVHNLSPSSC